MDEQGKNGTGSLDITAAKLVRDFAIDFGQVHVTQQESGLLVCLPSRFGSYRSGVHYFPGHSEADFTGIDIRDKEAVVKRLDDLKGRMVPKIIESGVYVYSKDRLSL